MFEMLAQLLAMVAMAFQVHPVPADFQACIAQGEAVFRPFEFVGVECTAKDGESWYAGVVWQDDNVLLETGP